MCTSTKTIAILSLLLLTASCAVISGKIRTEADTTVAFKTLLEQPDKYRGQTVILGGYILEIENRESETIIKALQAPLRAGEEPAARERSEGRFTVYYNGFLDPAVYAKDRAITVAGRVVGSIREKIGDHQITYLTIENREIYLWPEYKTQPVYPSPWPYYWYRYPYPYGYW